MHTLRALILALFSVAALANDGPFLSVPAGGIQFKKTDVIEMEKEDLFISEDKIKVAYVYRNTTAEDYTTEIAFPLPIYDLGEFEGEKPRYAQFTVIVDGKPVEYRTIDRAVLCDELKGKTVPTRAQLTPKQDVTDIVTKNGLVVADPMSVWDAIDKLSDAKKEELIKAGILKRAEEYVHPTWKVQTAYVWEQTFPANAELRVEHEYVPQIGYFSEWHLGSLYEEVISGRMKLDDVPKFGTDEFNKKSGDFLTRFDVDKGVLQWASKQRDANKRFGFTVVDYILTTAAYWKGPIKDFTLTIEKPEPITSAITTAISGLKKISDRQFQLKQKDFTPEKDLSIVFIHAYDPL